MSWWQFSLHCPAEELDRVEALLLDMGALSISLADAGDEPIYEPLPGDQPVWSESIITGTFDAKLDPEDLQQQLASALQGLRVQSVAGREPVFIVDAVCHCCSPLGE